MVTQHLLEDSLTYLRPAVLLTGRLQSSDQTFSVKGWTVDTSGVAARVTPLCRWSGRAALERACLCPGKTSLADPETRTSYNFLIPPCDIFWPFSTHTLMHFIKYLVSIAVYKIFQRITDFSTLVVQKHTRWVWPAGRGGPGTLGWAVP